MNRVIRQYAFHSLIDPIIQNPGPGVDGIHLKSKARPLKETELTTSPSDDYGTIARTVSDSGLSVIPGFRYGTDGSADWLNPAMWDAAGDLLLKCVPHSTHGMVATDGEDYAGGAELTNEWLETQGATVDVLDEAMGPFIYAALRSRVTIAAYPVDRHSAFVEVLRRAGVPVEAWSELSFSFVSTWRGSTEVHRKYLEQESLDRAHLVDVLGCTFRRGYMDDYLRVPGDAYRAEFGDEPAWIFDAWRSDRDQWGTQQWRTMETQTFANVVDDVWSCDPQSGLEYPPRVVVGDHPLTLYWGEGLQAPGYQEDHFIKHPNHWAPRGEWSAHGEVGRSTDETWSFTYDVRDVDGKIPICGIWWASGTNMSWCLYVEDGILRGRFSSPVTDLSMGQIGLGPHEFCVRQNAQGFTVDHPNGRSVIPCTPNLAPTVFRVGAVKQLPGDSAVHFLGRNGLIGHICHWARFLADDEVTRVMGTRYPWGS